MRIKRHAKTYSHYENNFDSQYTRSIKDFWGFLRHGLGFTGVINLSISIHSLLSCIDKKH